MRPSIDPPVRPLLIAQRSQLTASALQHEASRARTRLAEAGIAPEDRVALHLDESAESVVLLLALAAHGCSILLVDPRRFVDAAAASGAGGAAHVILPRIGSPETVAGRPGLWAMGSFVALPPGHVPGPPLDGTTPLLGPGPWWDRPDGVVLFSSGSTGSPRTVERRPADVCQNALATADALGYRPDDVLLPILPLSHQYGLSVLLIGLLRAMPVVVAPFRRPVEAVRLGCRWGATVLETTPEVYGVIARAVDRDRLARRVVVPLRLLGVGGGPIPRGIREDVLRVLGAPLLDGYGSTERGNVALADPARPEAGLLPLPGTEIRVVDGDGHPSAPGSRGRLEVRVPRETGAAWSDTGDLAEMSDDGRLRVLGRFAAMNRNGLVVHPGAVERQVLEEGIAGVALASGDGRTARLVLVVEDELRRQPAWWSRRIGEIVAESDLPDRILVRASLPRTTTGKVDRARVRALVEAREPADDPLVLLAARLLERRDEVIGIMLGYCSRAAAQLEFDAALGALRGAAAEDAYERPGRVGDSYVYLPSNVVLYSYVLYLLVPSRWTSRILFRPSSRARESTIRLHRLLAELHEAAIDVFEGSQREFEAVRAGRRGLVVFTGRHGNAEQVRAGLGPGHVMAFFGQGTNPMVVGGDADVARAARDVVAMRLLNSGQDCFGPDIVAVHRSRSEAFLGELTARLASASLEHLLAAPPGEVREVSDELVLHDVVQHVSRHRRAVRWGGRVDLASGIVEPTVLWWPLDAAPACSEVFAPVFNVIVYESEDDLRDLLDSPSYRPRQMGASLYGTTGAFARWCAERMTVAVDATLVAVDDPHQPFGGRGEIAGYLATPGRVRTGALLLSRVAHEFADVLVGDGEPADTAMTAGGDAR
jgi:long-chain acyl-CoA synthetase